MQDLDPRIALTDFFEVDLRGLRQGEQDARRMDREMQKMVRRAADYKTQASKAAPSVAADRDCRLVRSGRTVRHRGGLSRGRFCSGFRSGSIPWVDGGRDAIDQPIRRDDLQNKTEPAASAAGKMRAKKDAGLSGVLSD